MSDVHPDLRTAARFLPRTLVSAWTLPLLRALPPPSGPLPTGVTVTERALPGGVRVRIVSGPPSAAARPALLWIHGGGYVIGAARQDDALCGRFAQALDAVVVSVDYRLAPRHPYPAALDDVLAAYTFVHEEARALGIDPARVAIGGASAGGGLAAALVLRVHDAGLPAPALQLLVYPMLDDRTVSREVDATHHRVWSPTSNRLGWTAYLPVAPGSDGVPDHAAAARRADLHGLPPAWVGVGTHDLFHDEDLAYAARLRAAGVDVTTEVVEGAFHGFDQVLPGAQVSRAFFGSQVRALQHAFGRDSGRR
jgi:acetyl esterase/lipase